MTDNDFIQIRHGRKTGGVAAVRFTKTSTTLNAAARDMLNSSRVAIFWSESRNHLLIARASDDPDTYRVTQMGQIHCQPLQEIAKANNAVGQSFPVHAHDQGILVQLTGTSEEAIGHE